MLPKDMRDRLASVEAKIRDLRVHRARAAKVAEAAKAAAAESDDDATIAAAHQAVDAVKSVEASIEAENEAQVELLRRLGDAEHGRSAGFAWPGVNGWETAARTLSLATGNLRVDAAAQSLLVVPTPPQAPAPTNGATTVPVSNRYLFPIFAQAPFGPGIGDMAATDFTVEFGVSGLTGVEREPDEQVVPKARLPLTVGLATPKAKQHAVVSDPVPNAVINNQEAFGAFLGVELSRRLAESFDASVVDAIESASPPNGSTGADLVAKIRNAIADMRDLGGEATHVALDPATAASLDLEQDAGGYVFRVDAPRIEGAGSVVWSLRVREADVSDPLLVDPKRLGLVYTGEGSVALDPFAGGNFERNLTRVRAEAEAVLHIRNIGQGAFQIS